MANIPFRGVRKGWKTVLFLSRKWRIRREYKGVWESSLSSGVFLRNRKHGYSRFTFLRGNPTREHNPDERLDARHPGYSPREGHFLHKNCQKRTDSSLHVPQRLDGRWDTHYAPRSLTLGDLPWFTLSLSNLSH